jgi:hypothetical protein
MDGWMDGWMDGAIQVSFRSPAMTVLQIKSYSVFQYFSASEAESEFCVSGGIPVPMFYYFY